MSPTRRPVATDDEVDGEPPPKPLMPGVAAALSPLVRRIVAPTPG